MDQSIKHSVAKMLATRNTAGKLILMREFDPLAPTSDLDVPDPYNGKEADFETVYQMLDRSLDAFLSHLKNELHA
jgi:protein-tyrosine phosphatase